MSTRQGQLFTTTTNRDAYKAAWENMKAQLVASAYREYMRDAAMELYLYIQREENGTWGRFILSDQEARPREDCRPWVPVGPGLRHDYHTAQLPKDDHRIPCDTKEKIARWLEAFAGLLPMLGEDSKAPQGAHATPILDLWRYRRSGRYIIEKRDAEGKLVFGGLQPENVFGNRAITGLSEDAIAQVVFRHKPDAILTVDTINTWPAYIDPQFIARKKTW